MRAAHWLPILLVIACGNGARSSPPDGDSALTDGASDAALDGAGDADPPCDPGLTRCSGTCVDTNTSHEHCRRCPIACDTSATCSAGTCEPGQPVASTGTCTYIDQPGWLSCPTGMSCRCYYHYYKLFENQAGHVDGWLSDPTFEVIGGMIPTNQTLFGVTAATIPLAAGGTGKTGGVYPYTVNVSATNAVQLQIHASSGYVPAKFVLQTDSDCGNMGKELDCTFTWP